MTAQVTVRAYLSALVYSSGGRARSHWRWYWKCDACDALHSPGSAYRTCLEGAISHTRSCPAVKIASMRDRYRTALESCEAAYAADQARWEAERTRLRAKLDDALDLIAAAREAIENHPDPTCLLDSESWVSCGWKDDSQRLRGILAREVAP